MPANRAFAVRDAPSCLAGDMLEVDSPDGGRGQLPFDGISDLVSLLGEVFEAELGVRAARAGWFSDATNRAGCDDAGIPRGEEPRLAAFLQLAYRVVKNPGSPFFFT